MSKEMFIYAGSINRNHVHMLIGIPPQLSVSRAVEYSQFSPVDRTALLSRLYLMNASF